MSPGLARGPLDGDPELMALLLDAGRDLLADLRQQRAQSRGGRDALVAAARRLGDRQADLRLVGATAARIPSSSSAG